MSKLLVEGKLDLEIMNAVLGTIEIKITVERGGSKNGLRPRARQERSDHRATSYLRDRDFDHEPPSDRGLPTVDPELEGKPLGWRWCRHELESYLVAPQVMARALRLDATQIEAWILEAGRRLAPYQCARWTIGQIRRQLPPNYKLQTRPPAADKKDFALPPPGQEEAWELPFAEQAIEDFAMQLRPLLEHSYVVATYKRYLQRFDEEILHHADELLYWCSGKDLMAAVGALMRPVQCPGKLRSRLKDWVVDTPEVFLSLFPEWQALLRMLSPSEPP